jgi:hypothetical protein
MTVYKSHNMPEAGCDGRSRTSLCSAAFAHPGQHSRRLRGLSNTLPCLNFTQPALRGLSDQIILLFFQSNLWPTWLLVSRMLTPKIVYIGAVPFFLMAMGLGMFLEYQHYAPWAFVLIYVSIFSLPYMWALMLLDLTNFDHEKAFFLWSYCNNAICHIPCHSLFC